MQDLAFVRRRCYIFCSMNLPGTEQDPLLFPPDRVYRPCTPMKEGIVFAVCLAVGGILILVSFLSNGHEKTRPFRAEMNRASGFRISLAP